MQALPTELYEDIFSQIASPSDLHSLLLVSRDVKQEAERFLYKNISISAFKFSDTLAHALQNTRLASFVRRLEITSGPGIPSNRQRDCELALYTALPLLLRLQHLIIKGSLSIGRRTERSFLLENVTVLLETLIFDYIDHDHVKLLEKQTQLQELIMDHGGSAWDPIAFPHLRIMGCPGGFALRCLSSPNTRITRVQWTQGVPLLDWPPAPFAFILSLNVCLYDTAVKTFAKIMAKFTGLEYLKCTVRDSGFLQTINDEDLQRISVLELPALRNIYLQFVDPELASINQHRLFESIKSLQVVQLQSGNAPVSQCWHRRDPSQLISASSRPDEWKYDNTSISLGLEGNLGHLTLGDLP